MNSPHSPSSPGHDPIAVIDFGGQYAHLIATRIRRLGVRADIRQPEDGPEALRSYRGIIISGSPALASHGEDGDYDKAIYDLPVPILGLCFGHQEIARHYGGRVVHGQREWGKANLHVVGDSPILHGLGPTERVWMSHFDSVVEVGPEFHEVGYTTGGSGQPAHRFAAIASDSLRRYGFQFHPEVAGTERGTAMLANFALHVCGCEPSWSVDSILDETLERVRREAGDRSVFLLASGGVDSTVAAVVLGKALGPNRVSLLHVDNGLMRENESRTVLATFRELGLGTNLHFVDATEDFLRALDGVIEPEAKRARIGDAFIDVMKREASRLGLDDHLLGQGTIYPDTIETGGTRRADTIKTHHNRVPIIEEMIVRGDVIEPLSDLYKVEVRELGERLGIPKAAIHRHPFPGPGLGVRLLCSYGADDPEARALGPSVAQLAERFGLMATVLPIRSVGVKADKRSYERPVLLSPGTGKIDWDTLIKAVSAITAEAPGINRCVLNLGDHHPKNARPLAGTVTARRLATLRAADSIVMDGLRRHGVYGDIWQCPTVLLPVAFGSDKGEMVVIRPVRSERAMTATPVELPPDLLGEITSRVLALDGVGAVGLDVTSKPPGTIEWE